MTNLPSLGCGLSLEWSTVGCQLLGRSVVGEALLPPPPRLLQLLLMSLSVAVFALS
jgi:hypothetical protein